MLNDTLFTAKPHKAVPHEFVLDAIAALSPSTRSMFGCLAVYVEDKIVLALRDKRNNVADNGVWLATTKEHHKNLHQEFPNMRSIQVLGKGITGWQLLPADAPDFEEAALRACELIAARDPRIGKVPRVRRPLRSEARQWPKSLC
ncbi:MAG: TfoX/Sxy family protein [Acidobacteriota bacterium]|nr:TfoX/Sxy family protein [Acidobacteriota bacterium]